VALAAAAVLAEATAAAGEATAIPTVCTAAEATAIPMACMAAMEVVMAAMVVLLVGRRPGAAPVPEAAAAAGPINIVFPYDVGSAVKLKIC
jgi:hypothetical protein